ncbi:Cation-independent mannose-6-phosphate receptor CI-MPR [Knufia obscura]|uniref:Cation-independent mannose-6-phosphate receptor CI-MPR n=1 Tax=Knufia obscura TaxID=1635080 RepID=A0ABR0RIC4_9EURO|nr:Cation-independent mannose-6-phosphate receptor CI-MPR [Knufia obscura]
MRLSATRQRSAFTILTAIASLSTSVAATSDPKEISGDPCTIHSSLSGNFYDVRPLTLKESGTKTQAATNESYHSRGYDYGANFTINICGSVVEELDDVYGIPKKGCQHIAAFYTDPVDNTTYSMGQTNHNLTVRGRKLLLNYTNGSPCPDLDEYGDPVPYSESTLDVRKLLDGGRGKGKDEDDDNDDDDDDDEDEDDRPKKGKPSKNNRRKSTLLSFICDTSPALSTTPRISFLASPDHCSYVFEVRSRYACAGATPSHEKGTLGPAGVFVMILGIGVLVYLLGGVVYQRNVMHQRGWRQLPNYSLWAGMFSFVSDMFQIIFGSCLSRLPSTGRLFNSKRGGYIRVSNEDRRGGGGRGRSSDDENRLIDDLNEEWDD